MSTTIDQRVVEMQFDNRHFEKNVSTTMSTLDKLKQKLHLDGATKGLENVNTAARNVNMSPLGSAIDSVQTKFSAMQVIGVTALANITNSAVNAGKRIASALTIDPVKTGFQEYETQINAVQTILANTESKGTTIDDVNSALEELNKYADKTIYNFTEMTRNIGTFTAAGVDLDTSVNAIQGIANLAAVSGSTSQQASTAMYQLSQALSAGTVKLMDWNSVVNAGMGGEVFQNALKETARVHGIAIDDMIKEQGSFRETLSEGWITSEILTETLQKFTLTTEGLTDEQIKANREMLKAKGYTDEQIDGIFKLGNTATNAATKVKTFTQLWDVLKESAQSGWSQTWKIIIGDFEQAKSLLSPLAIVLTGVINKFSDARNKVLEKVFGGGKDSKWNGLSKTLDKAGLSMHDLSKASELLTGSSDKLNKSLEGTGTYTVKKGDYLYKIAKEYGTTWQEIYELNKDIIDDPDLIYPAQVLKMPGVFQEMAEGVSELTDEQLKNLGYTEEQITAWRELEKVAKENGMTIEELLAELSKPRSGRELLIDTFKNIGNSIAGVATAIKGAWKDIFGIPNSDQVAASIYNVLDALNAFSEKLRLTDEEGKLNENGQKIQRTFKGIFAAIDIVLTIVGGPLKIAFKLVTQLLSAFGFNILDVTAVLGDGIVKVRDWIDGILDFTGVFEKIVGPVKKAVKTFRDWIDSLKESENLPLDIAKGIASGFGKAVNSVKTFFKNIPKYFSNGFEGLSDSPIAGFVEKIRKGLSVAGKTIAILGDMILDRLRVFLSRSEFAGIAGDSIAGLVNGLKSGASKVWDAAVNVVSTLVQKVKDFLGIHSPSTVMIAIGGFIIAGLLKGLVAGLPAMNGTIGDIVGTLKGGFAELDLGKIFAGLMTTGLVVMLNKVADAFSGFGSMMDGVGDVLSGAGKIMDKSAGQIKNILKQTAKTIKAFNGILKSIAFETTTNGIKNLAISIAILAASIVVLSLIKPAKLWNAFGVIAALSVILGGLAFLINKMDSSAVNIDAKSKTLSANLKSGLLGIATALLMIGLVVRIIGTMEPEQAKQGLNAVGSIIIGLVALLGSFGVVAKFSNTGDMDKAAQMFSKVGTTILLMAVVVKILGGMTIPEVVQGTAVLAVLGGMIVGLIAATKLLTGDLIKSVGIDSVGPMLLKIGLTFGMMAILVKMLGGMTIPEVVQGTAVLAVLGGMIVGLIAATKLLTGNLIKSVGIDSVGPMLLKIALAIGMMAVVVKMLGGMTIPEVVQGTAVLAVLGGMIVGLVATTKLLTSNLIKGLSVESIGGTLLKIALAIGIMGLTVKILAGMTPGEIAKGILSIVAFGGIIAGLILLTHLASEKEMANLGKTLLGMSLSIGILAVVMTLLGFLDPAHIIKGIIAVGALASLMALMIWATKDAKGCEKNLYAMVAAIAVMALAVGILSIIDTEKLVGSCLSLALVMAVFALMIQSLKSLDNSAMGTLIVMTVMLGVIGVILYALTDLPVQDVLGSAVALSLLMGVLTGITLVLSKASGDIANAVKGAIALLLLSAPVIVLAGALAIMSNTQNAITNAIALSALTAAMVLLLTPLSKYSGDFTTALNGALALAVVAAALFVFVGVLWAMNGVQNAITNAVALITLATVMTLLITPLSTIGANLMGALKGAGALAVVAASLFVFVGVLWAMSGVENAIPNAMALIALATVMTLLAVILCGVGALVGMALAGALALTGVAASLFVFVGVLWAMSGIENAVTNANLLIDLMTAMTDALVKVSIIAPLALMGVAAIAAMSSLAVGLVGVLAVLGGLNLIPGFSELVEGGGEMLVTVGECLSDFMFSISGFIEGVKTVDGSVLTGVGILAAAILAMTAVDLIQGITELSPLSGNLYSLGEKLSGFMDSVMPFIEGAKAIDPSMLDGVRALAETILILTAANLVEGLTSFITGGSSLETFAAQLPILGAGMVAFTTSLGVFSEEQLTTVKFAVQAIKAIAQVANEIPNTGGLLSMIVGDNDLGTFASQFPILGSGLAMFLSNVGTFSDEQVATINCAADAIKEIANVASQFPNTGGLISSIVGSNDLGTFSSQFPMLGAGLSGFLVNIGTFTDEQVATVKCAAGAIQSLAQVANNIPNTGGLISSIVGSSDLGSFASQFPLIGYGLARFLSNIGTFTDDQVSTVKCASNAIKSLAEVANNIPNSGGFWSKIVGDNDLGDFASKFPTIGKGVKGFVRELGTFGESQIATVNAGISAIKALAGLEKVDLKSAAQNIPTFSSTLGGLGKGIANFCKKMPETSKVNSAVSNLNKLLDATKKIADVNSGVLATFANNLMKVGDDAVKKFVSAFNSVSARANVKAAAKTLAQQAIDGFKTKVTAAKFAGMDLGGGLVLGILSKMTAVYNAAFSLGRKAVQGEKDGQNSHSPSKETIKAGKWLGEGLVIGMEQMGDKVYAAGYGLGKTATRSMSASISRIVDSINSDIDTQPTIRPVLDLTSVRAGANAINGLLDTNSSIGVVANVGRISGMMNGYSQNGANSEIVSAIDKLNKRMDNLGNTTYQINGVTYDDGSNITDAVRTIVRAARIERRT